jgi:hypothetical protein
MKKAARIFASRLFYLALVRNLRKRTPQIEQDSEPKGPVRRENDPSNTTKVESFKLVRRKDYTSDQTNDCAGKIQE